VIENLRTTVRRTAARSAALLYAAYVGGLLVLTWPLLWLSLIAFPSGRPARGLARLWCQIILALAGCPIRVEGLEHLRGVGPAVLVANHSSYLDAVALLAGLPGDLRFVAKRELLRAPVIGTVIRKGGHLTVNRTDLARSLEDADRASAALRGGVSLLVFPEGTFVRAPGLLPFKLGAFKAASESGCPVIPVTIRGTREILPADTWLPRQGPITLAIDAPITPEGSGWPALVRLRDRSRETIARRLGEEPLSAS
jgi:1-acyl-sn-glycerol-3-phosphate acyltransferase